MNLKDWGKSGSIEDLGMKWHVPSAAEIGMAQEVLNRFLTGELDRIKAHVDGSQTLER